MMDYKYIEQLIERYWECQSTQLEERILQAFFSQEDIPEHLMKYRDVFTALDDVRNAHLDEDFDERILSEIGISKEESKPVKAIRLSLWQKIRPLYQAAAMVAIILTIGMAAQRSFTEGSMIPEESAQSVSENPDSIYTEMPQGMTNSSANAGVQNSEVDSFSLQN